MNRQLGWQPSQTHHKAAQSFPDLTRLLELFRPHSTATAATICPVPALSTPAHSERTIASPMILSASLPNRQSPHEKAGNRLTNSDDQDLENRTRIVALCCRRVRSKASHVGKEIQADSEPEHVLLCIHMLAANACFCMLISIIDILFSGSWSTPPSILIQH